MLFRPDRRTCIAQTMPQPILGHHLLPDHAEQTKFRERVKKLPGSPRESAIVSLGSILDAVLVLAPNLDPDRLMYLSRWNSLSRRLSRISRHGRVHLDRARAAREIALRTNYYGTVEPEIHSAGSLRRQMWDHSLLSSCRRKHFLLRLLKNEKKAQHPVRHRCRRETVLQPLQTIATHSNTQPCRSCERISRSSGTPTFCTGLG